MSSTIVNYSKVTVVYAVVAAVMTIVAGSVAFILLKDESRNLTGSTEKSKGTPLNLDTLETLPPKGMHIPTNLSRKTEEKDPMQYVADSNLNVAPMDIKAPEPVAVSPALESVKNADIKLGTKGDGEVRTVAVNGVQVPRELVEDAMFRNQDFMPRTDQYPIKEKPILLDPTLNGQRSMFGNLTHPINGLGMDVMRDRSDTRVNIAMDGGRYEN